MLKRAREDGASMVPSFEKITWFLRENQDLIHYRVKFEDGEWHRKEPVPPFPMKTNLLVVKSYMNRYHNDRLWDLLKVSMEGI